MKSIDTVYDGHLFRSRLEARWAVVFKTLKLLYLYEHEGYNLGGLCYLPDFYIPSLDCFFEVKGIKPSPEEKKKAFLLSKFSGKQVHILSGSIPLAPISRWKESAFAVYTFDFSLESRDSRYLSEAYTFNICPACGKAGFSEIGDVSKLQCHCTWKPSTRVHKRVATAFLRGRMARFENFQDTD